MVLETAQILCTAASINRLNFPTPYLPTHTSHPCVVWAAERPVNMAWLVDHFDALCSEYMLRNDRTHACEVRMQGFIDNFDLYERPPEDEPESFRNCAANSTLGLNYKQLPVHVAYKQYLIVRWSLEIKSFIQGNSSYYPKWTGRGRPDWASGPIDYIVGRLANA
jgi:hypothetical protein